MELMTALETDADELGTYFIDLAFKNELGVATAPNSGTLKISVTDDTAANTIVDQREPGGEAASMTITLSGADLAILAGETEEKVKRKVLIEYEYDSVNGSNLPANKVCVFWIRNYKAVTS